MDDYTGHCNGYQLKFQDDTHIDFCSECGHQIEGEGTRYWETDDQQSLLCDDCHAEL